MDFKIYKNTIYKSIRKKLHSFSMMEATIFILLTAMITAASMPLITRKHLEVPSDIKHGVYVCYYDIDASGEKKLFETRYMGKFVLKQVAGYPRIVSNCVFDPPKQASFFQISAIGGGGGGGDSGYVANYDNKINDIANPSPLGLTVGQLEGYKIDNNELKLKGGDVWVIAKGHDSNASLDLKYTACSCWNCEPWITYKTVCNSSTSHETDHDSGTWTDHYDCNCKTETTGEGENAKSTTTCETCSRQVPYSWTSYTYYPGSCTFTKHHDCTATEKVQNGCARYEMETRSREVPNCSQSCTTHTGGSPCGSLDQAAQGNCGTYTYQSCSTSCSGTTTEYYQVSTGNCLTYSYSENCTAYHDYETNNCGSACVSCTVGTFSGGGSAAGCPSCPCGTHEEPVTNYHTCCNTYTTTASPGNGGSGAICRTGRVRVQAGLSKTGPTNSSVSNGGLTDAAGDGTAVCLTGPNQHECQQSSYATTQVNLNGSMAKDSEGKNAFAKAYSSNRGGTRARITGTTSCGGNSTQMVNPNRDIVAYAKGGTNGSCAAGVQISTSSTSYCRGEYCYQGRPSSSVQDEGLVDIDAVNNTTRFKYAGGGFPGEFKTSIVRSLNNVDKTIHIGTGGSPGALGLGEAGHDGSATYIGSPGNEIVRAEGGKGGYGGINDPATEVPVYPAIATNAIRNGDEGQAPETNILGRAFVAASLKGDTLLTSIVARLGKGGQGGGSQHNCLSGQHLTLVENIPYINLSIFHYPEGTNESTSPATVAKGISDYFKSKMGYDVAITADDVTKAKSQGRMIPTTCVNNYNPIPGNPGLDGAIIIRW